MCLSVSSLRGHTGVNDLECWSSGPADCVCETGCQSACVFEHTNSVYVDFFFFSFLRMLMCTFVHMLFSLCSLAAEFPQSIRLHLGLIVFLLGLRDGLL